MNKFYLLIFFMSSTLFIYAQQLDSISLDKCIELSIKNMNIQKSAENNSNAIELQKKNLNSNYLPTLDLIGTATYQSEALKLDLPIPGVNFPEVPLDQYKAYLQINQLIYDGGITKSYSKLLDVSMKENELNTQISTINIQNSVANILFMEILLEKQEDILQNQLKTLNEQLKIVESSIKNDVLLPINRDILQSEILKLEQNLDKTNELKKSARDVLSKYTATDLTSSKIIIPQIQLNITDTCNSPKIELLNLQSQKLNILNQQLTAKRLPKVYAFGQAGYGRPGLNLLSDKFSPYFIGGITLSWRIYDWNNTSRNRQINQLKNQSLEIKKQNLQLLENVQKSNILAKINSTQFFIKKDEKIIKLTTNIVKTYDSQLKNGIITSSEYIIEVNKLAQAKLQLELHKIQLEQLKFQYNNIY